MSHNTIPSRFFDVEQAFSRKALRRICEADEQSFGDAYDMDRYVAHDQRGPENYYFYKNNGSNVLAVAHLDTVGHADDRACRFVVTEGAGTVVFSRALDDRLGAYIILELLPRLGLKYDILLTVGEESGQSTAQFFDPPKGKQYDYMIEFDRGGTDVVMYQYDDSEVRQLVRDCGAKVGDGSFSDISYLGHLGIKGFNWGVGYRDYHGPRAHAFLDDTFAMVAKYLTFAEQNEGVYMPHDADDDAYGGRGWGSGHLGGGWGDYLRETYGVDPLDPDWKDEFADNGHVGPDWRDEYADEHADRLSDLDRGDAPDSDWNEYPSLREIDAALDAAAS